MTTFNTIALTETVVESFWLNRLSQKDVPFYFKRPSESYLIWSQSESSETDRCNQFTVQRSLPLNPPSRFTLDLIDLETNFYSLNIDFILLHWKYFHICLNTATYQSIVIEFSCTAAFHHIELPWQTFWTCINMVMMPLVNSLMYETFALGNYLWASKLLAAHLLYIQNIYICYHLLELNLS